MIKNGGAVRVGVFDQIVSGGGVYKFTLRLLEGLSIKSGGRWDFHLMWPLFDSGGEFLHEVRLPNVSFERIGVSFRSRFCNVVAPVLFRNNRGMADLDIVAAIFARKINKQQLSDIRTFRGKGLDWLDDRKSSFDLLYFPYTFLTYPKNRDWSPGKPLVLTLHDLAHEFTDAWGDKTGDVKEEVKKWLNAATHVVFSSRYIQRESIRIYGISEERTSCIYLAPLEDTGVDRDTGIKIVYPFGQGYVFTIGWAAKHKRTETVIEGFARYRRKYNHNIPLVIAGPHTERLSINEELGLKKNKDIFLLGYVKDEDIPRLYRDASAVITASVSEAGFNSMIYDAMSFKTPIICSSIPQFIERLGTKNEMAITFDPYDPESLCEALRINFRDPDATRQRVRKAKEYISRRNWEDVAEDYLGVFERARKTYSERSSQR